MSERVDAVVIGAGVVGLAVARALALAGREVTIVEAAHAIGTGASSRNSEVIHGGLYYAPGSWKARLCVRGRELLYAYCAARGVAHRRCGKLIVATDPSQHDALERIAHTAHANGVDDLERRVPRDVAAHMPGIAWSRALWSPSTGIVDSHALMLALLGDAQAHGALLALHSAVIGGRARDDAIELDVRDDSGSSVRLHASLVINAAGLDAQRVAASIEGMPARSIPAQRLAKGNYFALNAPSPAACLVYPVPEPGGLGVHLTIDLAGRAKFGPDVEWLAPDAPRDYRVDGARAERFAAAIRRYWPDLPDDALAPAYAGIRPKLDDPAGAGDFVFAGPRDHGVAGLVHLFGIESPGLTSALAIGEMLATRYAAPAAIGATA